MFEGRTPFNVLGGGYQRPFELATLRLSNMLGILPKCALPEPSAQMVFAGSSCSEQLAHIHALQASTTARLPSCQPPHAMFTSATPHTNMLAECFHSWGQELSKAHLRLKCWLLAGGQLCPENEELLTQQGGCLVFRGEEVIFRHDDSGILKYTNVDAMIAACNRTVSR